MRILVIGKSGQLASEFSHIPMSEDCEVKCMGRPEIDISNLESVESHTEEYGPDFIINTAAYTEVDKAESEEEAAYEVNEIGAAIIAKVARNINVPCIYISTDYVFDGNSNRPYQEQDKVNPQNVYGKSKEAGERAVRAETSWHIIIRTSWVYSPHGKNFVRNMLELMVNNEQVKVIDDQPGSPTSAIDLAIAIQKIVEFLSCGKDCYGTYHLTGTGVTNWYNYAKTIQDIASYRLGKSWKGKRDTPQIIPDPRILEMDRLFTLANKTVLEAGCFEGVHTIGLAKSGAQVYAIDSRIENVIKTRVRTHLFGYSANVSLCDLELSDDFARLPCVNIMHHVGVLYHLKDPVPHLLSIGNIVDDGLLLCTHYATEDMLNDALVDTDNLFKLKEALMNNKDAGIAGPQILNSQKEQTIAEDGLKFYP
ncbi:MAG: dTDP-4-dehydrorhamnose reductase [Proteobacteria bacterium]|nr:dTDP-4-dehydrorhamnose reductase [Pseudomonadota bacterium]